MPLNPRSLWQQLSTVQDEQSPTPRTIASAATIAPDTFITFVSGTAAVVTVTPPVLGAHMLILIPTGAFTMTTAGNITTACTAAVNSPVVLLYNPITGKYFNSEIPVAA